MGRGARGAGTRARRTLARPGAGGDDGDELAGVVALHARRHRAPRVAGGDLGRGRRTAPRPLRGRASADRRCGRDRPPPRFLVSPCRCVVVEPQGDRRRSSTGGLTPFFEATVSSEEVARGKPAPDVFLEAARRLDVPPQRCAAIEDSGNGLRAAHAAGMRVIAIPNRRYPPPEDALALADARVDALDELTREVV